MSWADLAVAILNAEELYTVTYPSFDAIPIMSEDEAKKWIEKLIKEPSQFMAGVLSEMPLQEFRESFFEKDGKLEMRRTYQTNKKSDHA